MEKGESSFAVRRAELLSAQNAELLETIPEVIRELSRIAKSFNDSSDQFFTSAITSVRCGNEALGQEWSQVLHFIKEKFELTSESPRQSVETVKKSEPLSRNENPIDKQVRCFAPPLCGTLPFFERPEIFETLDSLLDPEKGKESFQSVVLYGPDGVGPRSISLNTIGVLLTNGQSARLPQGIPEMGLRSFFGSLETELAGFQAEFRSAFALSESLGGHTLNLSHAAGLIRSLGK
ncbi:hypothetical protein F4809DRAFT_644186 [Biscogniauxia mediterranea]|nr:hypothetical protein F4809DRAFT_644186 [Biscogniauxia mediterranea]